MKALSSTLREAARVELPLAEVGGGTASAGRNNLKTEKTTVRYKKTNSKRQNEKSGKRMT